MLLVCQFLLKTGDLRLETVNRFSLRLNSALLLVWVGLSVDGSRAKCLLEETNQGRWSL